MNSGPNRLLFNFSQFSQKMPPSLQEAHAHDLTDKEAHDLAEQHVVYDHTDDGELMQMLFGMADDVPTMATIHLHDWHNVDDDQIPPHVAIQRQNALGAQHRLGSTSNLQAAAHASSGGNGQPAQAAGTAAQQPLPHSTLQQGQQQSNSGYGQQPGVHQPNPGDASQGKGGAHGDFATKHSIDSLLGNCGDEREHLTSLDAEMHQFLQSVE